MKNLLLILLHLAVMTAKLCGPGGVRAVIVRSIKEECLRRVVPLGEGHLRRLVHEYVEHDHGERNHHGLDNQLLSRAPPHVRAHADVQRRTRLGGLLSFYHREAA